MLVSVKNTRTGHEDICCITCASDLIGMYRDEIYDKLKENSMFKFRYFEINKDVNYIKQKKRGKPRKL